MPQAFDDCVARGGRVRTVKPNRDTVLPICFIDGKSHAGYPRKVGQPSERKAKPKGRHGLHGVGAAKA